MVNTLGLILCLSGLIGSAFSLLQFFSAPLTGAASDYLGRRPVMMLSLVSLWSQLSTGRGENAAVGLPCQQWAPIPSRGIFWPLVLHQAKYT